jgi:enoyl-[acyl-carrier protein] reductase I
VLSNRSIAYGIAKACHREGAELAFSYVGERFKDRITEFAGVRLHLIFDCDVGDDAQIERLFTELGEAWPEFDGFVHSIGFAPREAIAGDFLDGLSRERLPHRARHLGLQLPGHGQGRPAAPAPGPRC